MLTLRERYPVLVEEALTHHWLPKSQGEPRSAIGNTGGIEEYVDSELATLVASAKWDEIVSKLFEVALTLPERPLSDLLPGLSSWFDLGVENPPPFIPPLTVRTRHCLQQAGKMTWGSVAETSLLRLLKLRNFGVHSARDLWESGMRLSANDGPTHEREDVHSSHPASILSTPRRTLLSEWLQERERFHRSGSSKAVDGTSEPQDLSDARAQQAPGSHQVGNPWPLIAAWASTECSAAKVSEFLQLVEGVGPMPKDVEGAWIQFLDTDPVLFADPEVIGIDVNDLAEYFLSAFDARSQFVLEKRVFTENPLTLAEIGEELGVTRERIRQIQAKLERRISKVLQFPRFRPLRWRATTLASALGSRSPMSAAQTSSALEHALRGARPTNRGILQSILLALAGNYRVIDGWFVRDLAPTIDPRALEALEDENGLLPISKATAWLNEQGLKPPFQDAWLTQFANFRRFGDVLASWNGRVVDKCVSLLAIRASPADAEGLVSEIGEGPQRQICPSHSSSRTSVLCE